MGLMNARKLMKRNRQFRWHQKAYKKRILKLKVKADPLEGTAQAKGIVVGKFQKEARQPNSAMRKCCKVQLIKNGISVGAFIPGISFQVIKVNDQPLRLLWKGKIEKGRR